MIKNARKLFETVVDKVEDSSRVLLLGGSESKRLSPSQPGLIESHNETLLSLRTASSEAKGTLTGFGFLLGAAGLLLFILDGMAGESSGLDWVLLSLSFLIMALPAVWELSRPPSLPIVFNRRTQEIYYDLKGELYHAPWDGIEAVAYEYNIVNQYSGAIAHGNLEVILQKFGAPDSRIALNLSGLPSGKRMHTLVGMWEYLKCFMTIGPWFDERGEKTTTRSSFIEEGLKAGDASSLDLLMEERSLIGREKQEGNGVSGTAFIYWLGSYFFFPVALGELCVQRIDRMRSKKHWPEVVQERLDPNGPTTRLIDIEENYMAQKQKELDELHERMRKTLPR